MNSSFITPGPAIFNLVEDGIQLQQSFMFFNVISSTLWHSPKAADSVRHDKVLDNTIIT